MSDVEYEDINYPEPKVMNKWMFLDYHKQGISLNLYFYKVSFGLSVFKCLHNNVKLWHKHFRTGRKLEYTWFNNYRGFAIWLHIN